MSDFSVRSPSTSNSFRLNRISAFPRQSLRTRPMHDDSDDENMLGPPKLSNFGSALLLDKENENVIDTNHIRGSSENIKEVKMQDALNASHRMSLGLVPKQLSSNNTNNNLAVYPTLHSEDGSQSTMFATSRQNQPSMTTLNATDHEQDSVTSGKDDESYQKLKNMQHTFREELSQRHSKRRNRRFISPRLSLLGPAKRAYSAAGLSNQGQMAYDSNNSQQDVNTPNSSNVSSTLNSGTNEYNVFYDPHVSDSGNFNSNQAATNDAAATYEDLEFGDLNPYQYLKKHNLPTTELPNISKIYFEKQKGENRRTALRKNHASKEAFYNRITSNLSSGTLEVKGVPVSKDENSVSTRQPRRKPSDGSISTIAKSLSSPIVIKEFDSYSPRRNEEIEPNGKYDQPFQYGRDTLNYLKGREALANIDINRKDYEPQNKKFKSSTSNSEAVKRKIYKESSYDNFQKYEHEHGAFHHRNAPSPPAMKRVEIIEPIKRMETVPLKPPATSVEYSKRKLTIEVNGTEYEKMELLGRGGTSKVYKVKSTINNRIYALKRVSFDEFDDASIEGFKGEIELLKKLEAKPRVVKLIDHEMDHGVLYVVMECGDHDLYHILAQRSSMPLDIEFVRYHAQEMLKCVKVVHDADIVHSDLKPANFVFVKGILKIIDFGIANAVPDHTVNIYRETQIGTPNYMAPEALVAMNYSQGQSMEQNRWKVGKPSDIWSCGCIIYQMIYGRPPYGGFQGQNRLLAIMNPEVKIVYPEKNPGGDIVPRTAIDTMKACLERNPDKRWTVDEALNGPFIRPVTVTHFFIRDLIKNAVKYGADQRKVSSEKVEELADDVWHRLADFKL